MFLQLPRMLATGPGLLARPGPQGSTLFCLLCVLCISYNKASLVLTVVPLCRRYASNQPMEMDDDGRALSCGPPTLDQLAVPGVLIRQGRACWDMQSHPESAQPGVV